MALGQICQTFLDFNPDAKHRRHRPHLNVTMTYEQWSTEPPATYLDTGMPVSTYGLDVLRCDAARHRLTFTDRAAILRYGRTMRDWPVELYNAIAIRDGGCRWPGCTAPVHWCDVHHVHFWEHGGPTDIDNGLLLCRRHHRKLHSKARLAAQAPARRHRRAHPPRRHHRTVRPHAASTHPRLPLPPV